MTSKDPTKGFGLSSEQYDDDQLLEVDNRSVEYDELREQAKNPKATWSGDEDRAAPGEAAADADGTADSDDEGGTH